MSEYATYNVMLAIKCLEKCKCMKCKFWIPDILKYVLKQNYP